MTSTGRRSPSDLRRLVVTVACLSLVAGLGVVLLPSMASYPSAQPRLSGEVPATISSPGLSTAGPSAPGARAASASDPAPVGWPRYGSDFNDSYAYAAPSNWSGASSARFTTSWSSGSVSSGGVLTAPLLGSASLEVVSASSPYVDAYYPNGSTLWTLDPVKDSGLSGASLSSIDISVVNNSPVVVTSVSTGTGTSNGASRILVYAADGDLLKTITGPTAGGISDAEVADLGANGSYEVVATATSGYTLSPRGVYVYGYATGAAWWNYQMAPDPSLDALAPLTGTGQLDLVLGDFAPCNGYTVDGTSDCAIYVIVLSPTGSVLWKEELGSGNQQQVSASVADLNANGTEEVLAYVRSNNAVCSSCPNTVDELSDTTGAIWASYAGVAGDEWDGFSVVKGSAGLVSVVVDAYSGKVYDLTSSLKLADETKVVGTPGGSGGPATGTVVTGNFVAGQGPQVAVLSQLSNGTNVVSMLNGSLSVQWTRYLAATSSHAYTSLIASDLNGDGLNALVAYGSAGLAVLSPPAQPLTFTESGLPVGTAWSVTVNGTTNSSTTPSIGFVEPNGTYAYTVAGVAGFTGSPRSGSVTVTGGATVLPVSFVVTTYPVLFGETGLPAGALWSVSLNGTPSSSITPSVGFEEPNGSYAFVVAGIPGFTATPGSGSLVVADGPVNLTVDFTVSTYAISFDETGLPAGTGWSTTLNGTTSSSTNSTLGLVEPNGTYAYTVPSLLSVNGAWYDTASSEGRVTVSGTAVTVTVSYTQPTTALLTFREAGLPSGQRWGMSLGYAGYSLVTTSTRSSLTVSAPETTLPYAVAAPSGYSVASVVGPGVTNLSWVTVTGPATLQVTIGHLETLTFEETGLGTGVAWSVTIASALKGGTGSQAGNSTGTTLAFPVVSGPYRWVVRSSTNEYAPKRSEGTVGVGQVAKTVKLVFELQTSKVTFKERGLPRHTTWEVAIAGAGTYELTGASLTVRLPNGTYNYTVTSSNPDYVATTAGSFAVMTPEAVHELATFSRSPD